MHPSTAQARVIVDELVRCGVRHVVACPGSRNAPLSMALFDAATAGRLTLHVRIDERSAAFFALGIGRAGAGPAAVCCTSGTAVANLHPATLEAHHSGVPLLLLTADRPAELLGTGANQTIAQRGLFGGAAPCVDMPLAERRAGGNAVWRGVVCRAVALARTGPVQLNLPFREPLVPDGTDDWPEPLTGRDDDAPWTRVTHSSIVDTSVPVGPRTLVIAGDGATGDFGGAPVIAEPTADVDGLAYGSLLLNAGPLPARLHPDDIVIAGRPTLTRGVGAAIRAARRVVVLGSAAGWTDPQRLAAEVTGHVEFATPDPGWLAEWAAADAKTAAVADKQLAGRPWSDGLRVVRDIIGALPADAPLFLGSSNAIRFADFAALTGNRRVLANRGVAGIDGSVSTAAGIAVGSGRTGYALLGDLTFLHDINGLLIGPGEQRPDLTIIVLNDDGGGIFALLEQGAPEFAPSFERVFGTPHGANLAALCAGYGVPHTLVAHADDLAAALSIDSGLRVIEIPMDRQDLRDRQGELFTAIHDAIDQ